jgi:hypothetical protein
LLFEQSWAFYLRQMKEKKLSFQKPNSKWIAENNKGHKNRFCEMKWNGLFLWCEQKKDINFKIRKVFLMSACV